MKEQQNELCLHFRKQTVFLAKLFLEKAKQLVKEIDNQSIEQIEKLTNRQAQQQTNKQGEKQLDEQVCKVYILPHHRADGDAIGSAFGLKLALEKLNWTSEVVLEEELTELYSYLNLPAYTVCATEAQAQALAQQVKVEKAYVCLVDNSAPESRLGTRKALFAACLEDRRIIIDHHVSDFLQATEKEADKATDKLTDNVPDNLLDNVIEKEADKATEKEAESKCQQTSKQMAVQISEQSNEDLAKQVTCPNSQHNFDIAPSEIACSGMVAELLLLLEQMSQQKLIDTQIANCLMTGIITDSGQLSYAATSSQTYLLMAILKQRGADQELINRLHYHTMSLAKMQMIALAFSQTEFYYEKRCIVSTLSIEQLTACQAKEEDIDGISSMLRELKGVDVAVLLRSTMKGNVLGSIRSSEKVNCQKIAKSLGGGGHERASGFTLYNMDLKTAKKQFVAACQGPLGSKNAEQ